MILWAIGGWRAGDGGSDRVLGCRASSGRAFGGGRSAGEVVEDGGFRGVPADPGACIAAAERPSKGVRPGFDVVLKFKMLVLQSLHGLALGRTAYLVRDRLSWMRFCGLGPGDAVPDANTLWDFREALIKEGKVPEEWRDKPAKLRQKDRDARWTVEFSKGKVREGGTPQGDITIPHFGYKNHVSIDRKHGIIRRALVTDAAAADGARLREGLIDPANTASDVWADSAYRSKANEAFLAEAGKVSRIHRKKPKGKPMPRATARANAVKSRIRSRVEHVFAEMKGRMGLVIRTIGLARARAAITLANMAYDMKRWSWLDRQAELA
uniref:Transposase, IS4 n=1 Tax=Pararhodospirillum photometricum DSM 122 TaxID=1150469 RepID=H6SKU7_PARPM